MATDRRPLYAKIAIARQKLPGFDEEAYRALLMQQFGKTSGKDLTIYEFDRLLHLFAKMGVDFVPNARNKKVRPHARPDWIEITDSMPYASMKRQIAQIWKKLGYSLASLEERVARQCKVPSLTWVHDYDQLKAILTDLQKREKAFEARNKA